MARQRRFRIGAVNIVLHPHSPQHYVELWRRAFRMRLIGKLRGDYRAIIGSMTFSNDRDPTEGITGQIYKFFDIDVDGGWFDLENAQEAEPEAVEQINIPANLKPDLTLFNYVFYPRTHRLVFETHASDRDLSPRAVASFLQQIFSHPTLEERFGKADVTVLPRHDSVDRVLSLSRLSTVEIDLKKPNADDLADVERRVMERLAQMKARRLQETITAEKGESLELDEEAKQLAEVAAQNGKVVSHGALRDGTPETRSTQDLPLSEMVRYDPTIQSALEALVEAGARVAARGPRR